MSLSQTYAKLLADLERELIEVDRDLATLDSRRDALGARKNEVEEGINGIRKILEANE